MNVSTLALPMLPFSKELNALIVHPTAMRAWVCLQFAHPVTEHSSWTLQIQSVRTPVQLGSQFKVGINAFRATPNARLAHRQTLRTA